MDKHIFWNKAYRNNAPRLLGVLRRYVPDRELAQDLLQETFIIAIQKQESYSNKGSFEGWLHRIAVNTALMHLRSNQQRSAPESLMDIVANDQQEPEEEVESTKGLILTADFSSDELLTAIDKLPEHHKLVFNMYVMDDFSHQQIADELGISAGTSKSHLARARKKVQQHLYEEALKKKEKRNRKWAFLLFVIPAKTHYIDKLYRSQLGSLSFPVSGSTSFMSAAIQQSAVTGKAIVSTTFWGSKLFIVAASCGSAAVVSAVCWLTFSNTKPIENNTHHLPAVVDTTSIIEQAIPKVADTIIVDKPVVIKKEKQSNVADTPVVVTKKIIQRRTIIVRDTVVIEE